MTIAPLAEARVAPGVLCGLPPSEERGLLWAPTKFVEYRVPVEIPDLMARVRAAVERGVGPRTTATR